MKALKRTLLVVAASIGLGIAILGTAIVRHQWFFSYELVKGVELVQVRRQSIYDIRTAKGEVIKNVFGWIVRPDYAYGSCVRGSYFLIDLHDFKVSRFSSLSEINQVLKALDLPRYNMNDEENTSHLIYHGGRNRKYR